MHTLSGNIIALHLDKRRSARDGCDGGGGGHRPRVRVADGKRLL